MRRRVPLLRFIAAVAVVVAALVFGGAEGRITHLSTEHDDRHVFHIGSFGYEPNGVFELELSDFMVFVPRTAKHPEDKEYDMAFVLQLTQSEVSMPVQAAAGGTATCFHKSMAVKDTDQVFKVESGHWSPAKHTYRIDQIRAPGYYHLFFSNCAPDTQVKFSIKLTEYNMYGNVRNYLSAGESSLPVWFFLICGAFGALLVTWVGVLGKGREHVRTIHHLMTLVLVVKLTTLLFESMEYHYIKTTGMPHGWNVAYYILSFVKGMLFFSAIALIGTGWSYLKPFLTERDKQLMLVMLVVQGIVNMAIVVVDETSEGSREWLMWRDLFHILDMACCCLILMPIVWSIRHLRESAEVDGKAAANMERLKRFRKFYLLVVMYIYFTRIIVILLSATLSFEWAWLGTVFTEAAALAFYATTGYLFRPQPDNPYFKLKPDASDPDAALV